MVKSMTEETKTWSLKKKMDGWLERESGYCLLTLSLKSTVKHRKKYGFLVSYTHRIVRADGR